MRFRSSLASRPRPGAQLGLVALVATLLLSLAPTTLPTVLAADPVLVGAGDIAKCGPTLPGAEATAKLLDTIPGTVFAAGDLAYDQGTATEFANCYAPTWGRHKARTRPAPGNHEYGTPGATGYYGYFGAAAGDPAKGYYSYNLGTWHIIVLNSQCTAVGGCEAGSPQEQWLRADLAAHPAACTLAYWHHSRFSSSTTHPSDPRFQPFWEALRAARADVVLTGHSHTYERFAPQDPAGRADPNGLRAFVVGTGGKGLTPFGTPEPNSVVRSHAAFGVLKLTLHPTSYDWQFVPVAGATFTDSGTATCTTDSPPPTGANLLRNGSFETDQTPVDGKADDWSIISAFTRSNAVTAQHGSYSGQLSATTNQNHSIGQTVPNLTPGTRYSFTGWVNIPAQTDSTFLTRLQVRWQNGSNTIIRTDLIADHTVPTSGWTRVNLSSVAPQGAAKARIQVVVNSLNGKIYIDQFVFRP